MAHTEGDTGQTMPPLTDRETQMFVANPLRSPYVDAADQENRLRISWSERGEARQFINPLEIEFFEKHFTIVKLTRPQVFRLQPLACQRFEAAPELLNAVGSNGQPRSIFVTAVPLKANPTFVQGPIEMQPLD